MPTTSSARRGQPRVYPKLWGYSVTSVCYRLGQLEWDVASAHAALEKVLGCRIKLSTVRTGVSDGDNPKYEQGRAAPRSAEQIARLSQAAGRPVRDAVATPLPELPPTYPDEIADLGPLPEGACRIVKVNAFERNLKARQKCIAHFGARCWVCKFDFGEEYGPEFVGFIHVHHLRPLSEIGREYEVKPIEDLRPVCPNCHAVIHHGGRLRSIEEVRQLLACQRQGEPDAAHGRDHR